jgi:hypothetical protein
MYRYFIIIIVATLCKVSGAAATTKYIIYRLLTWYNICVNSLNEAENMS